MNQSSFQVVTPYVTFEEYSRISGLTLNTIRHLVREGSLPIRPKLKPKEKPFINMLALLKEADEQEFIRR